MSSILDIYRKEKLFRLLLHIMVQFDVLAVISDIECNLNTLFKQLSFNIYFNSLKKLKI